MRAYLRLFFTLLAPVGIVAIGIAMFHYVPLYSLVNAIKISVLYGTLVAIIISMILAGILYLYQRIQVYKEYAHESDLVSTRTTTMAPVRTQSQGDSNEQDNKDDKKKTLNIASIQKHALREGKKIQKSHKVVTQQIMLMMDRELTMDLIEYARTQQKIGDDTLRTEVNKLTKHSTEVVISASTKTQCIQRLIAYLKGKERAYLKY